MLRKPTLARWRGQEEALQLRAPRGTPPCSDFSPSPGQPQPRKCSEPQLPRPGSGCEGRPPSETGARALPWSANSPHHADAPTGTPPRGHAFSRHAPVYAGGSQPAGGLAHGRLHPHVPLRTGGSTPLAAGADAPSKQRSRTPHGLATRVYRAQDARTRRSFILSY